MVQVKNSEDREEIVVGDSLATHYVEGIWVDDLLAERTRAEVGSLRDIENLGQRGFANGAAINGPKAPEDSEEG